MIEAALVIEAVRTVSGSTDKMRILRQYAEVEGLKEILRFIYNPYLRTGISHKKLAPVRHKFSEYEQLMQPVTYVDIMKYLSEHNTGSDFDVSCCVAFMRTTYALSTGNPVVMRIAEAIITQDLQIGATANTLNKVFGDSFIPKTGCILAKHYKDIPPAKRQWPYIVTEKLDGNRRIFIKEGNLCRCYTRSGHEDSGLYQIMDEMQHLPSGYAYDCELLAIGEFSDCIALRQATSSIANRRGQRRGGLTANLFDMVPSAEFRAGMSREGARVRKIRLGATLRDESISWLDDDFAPRIAAFGIEQDLQFVKSVPILALAQSMEDVEPIAQEIWARGFEGVMLNSLNGLYKVSQTSRSNDLLKLKKVKEFVLPVVDLVEGDNKYEGMMGAAVVEYKGQYVKVGSGFNDYQRLHYWSHPEDIVGHTIEIESFGESTNLQGGTSLNCPIFKRVAGVED